jgi:Fcf2 pre-rRNA processing
VSPSAYGRLVDPAQVKQDLRMLALRGALDPKRFYRNPDATKFPKYFQMGTVVGGPTDFYTGAQHDPLDGNTLHRDFATETMTVQFAARMSNRLTAGITALSWHFPDNQYACRSVDEEAAAADADRRAAGGPGAAAGAQAALCQAAGQDGMMSLSGTSPRPVMRHMNVDVPA